VKVPELQARYKAACKLDRPVQTDAIALHLKRFFGPQVTIRFLQSLEALQQAALALHAIDSERNLKILRGEDVRQIWSPELARNTRAGADDRARTSAAKQQASLYSFWQQHCLNAISAWNAWSPPNLGTAFCRWNLSGDALICVGAAEQGDRELYEQWLPILQAFEAGAWTLYPTQHEVPVASLPELLRFDEQQRLHCADGPAFVWHGHRQYRWHGLAVPARVIEQPASITVDEIDSGQARAIRPVLLERYGEARYITDGGMDPAGIQARYEAACRFTQAVERPAIVAGLRQFFQDDDLHIVFLESSSQLNWRDLGPISGTPTGLAERFRQKFWSQGWPAPQGKDCLRNLAACYDLAFLPTLGKTAMQRDLWDDLPRLMGAAQQADRATYDAWLPLLEAFEAGACRLYPSTTILYVVTVPHVLHTDAQGRLHCDDGPAFVWQDVELWFCHGRLMPQAASRFLSLAEWCQLSQPSNTPVIEQLRPEQAALLPVFAAKWDAINRSTAPADRALAEQAVRLAYAATRLPPPKTIAWMPSPYAIALAYRQAFATPDWASFAVELLIRMQVLLRHCQHLRLAPAVYEALRSTLSARASFSDHVYFALPAQEGQLWRLFTSLPTSLYQEFVPNSYTLPSAGQRERFELLHGQHGGAELAWRDYCREVFGLQSPTDPIVGPLLLAQSANWWLPCEEICWVSERPRQIQFDTHQRLHRADGPAIEYHDGWGVYCWHGIAVPEHVILLPEAITLAEIDQARNVEYRRVLLERYGEGRYILESGAEVLHEDDFGTLYRRIFADDEPLVMVRVVNSTPEPDGSYKHYWLRVPPTLRTAHEAVAWTFGMTNAQYYPRRES
jgi:hypothetical protein